MVGRRCVPFGGRWGCENRGVQVSDYSMCMSRRWRGGGAALCVVEGVGLVRWGGECLLGLTTQVCCVCWPVVLDYCPSVSDRSSTRGPEDDSVESKHVAPLSHYMFNFTTVVSDGTSPAFYFTNTSGWNTSSSTAISILVTESLSINCLPRPHALRNI